MSDGYCRCQMELQSCVFVFFCGSSILFQEPGDYYEIVVLVETVISIRHIIDWLPL